MITMVAARTMTVLKIRNLAVFDAGTMSRKSWLIEASEAGMKDRHQQDAVSGHVENHTNRARAKNSDPNSMAKTTGSRHAPRSCSSGGSA